MKETLGKSMRLYFNPHGRIDRSRWWVHGFFVTGLLPAIPLLWLASSMPQDSWWTIGVMWLWAGPALMSNLVLAVKRLHDCNQPAGVLLLFMIPAIGGVLGIIWLGFIKGSKYNNRYGAPNGDG